jgi:Lhr-like helicase
LRDDDEYKKWAEKVLGVQTATGNSSSIKSEVDKAIPSMFAKSDTVSKYLKLSLKDLASKSEQANFTKYCGGTSITCDEASDFLEERAEKYLPTFTSLVSKVSGSRKYVTNSKRNPRLGEKMDEYIKAKRSPLALHDLVRGTIYC